MMGKEIVTFGNTEIEKQKFDHGKNLALLEDLDIDKIQVSSMVSSGEKIYCTGYKDDGYKIKLLHIMLLKRSTSVKSYDGEAK